MQGTLEEINDSNEKKKVKSDFIDLIKKRKLSSNVLMALGYDTNDPLELIIQEDRNMLWRLKDVKEIVALKNK